MPLGMEVGLSLGDFVLDGDPAPYPKRGAAPQFSAHVDCGRTAAWIEMPLGTDVGRLRDIVFDVDAATHRKKAHPSHPIFGPCLLWPNGWMWPRSPISATAELLLKVPTLFLVLSK